MLSTIDTVDLAAGLLGGLGLFLLGLRQLTDSLKRIAGDRLASLVSRLTTNRFTAVLTGIVVTAVVQSSSITTVLAVGFVTAGAMTFQQSIGIVLGANVGTTITAQTIAFDIGTWALALVAVGALGLVFSRGSAMEVRASGVLGLGLVFFGMQVMSDAVSPLRTSEAFNDAMAQFSNPVLGIAAGALFTALLQSSSATSAMVITLAAQGLIGLPAGAAIIIGANVGSCATAAIAAIGKPDAARRVAGFHVLVNLLGAAAWVFFLDELIGIATAITPGSGGTSTARQLANAHTVFNVSVMLALFPLAGRLGALVERIIGSDEGDESHDTESQLDRDLLSTPALALAAVRLELGLIGDRTIEMVASGAETALQGTRAELDALAGADDSVDRRHRAVVAYLSELGHQPLSTEQAEEVIALAGAADALESIADIVETNMVALGHRRLDAQITHDRARADAVRAVHTAVLDSLRAACGGIAERDGAAAEAALVRKAEINRLIDTTVAAWMRDLATDDRRAILAHTVQVDIVESLRRVHDTTRRLARARLAVDQRTDAKVRETPAQATED